VFLRSSLDGAATRDRGAASMRRRARGPRRTGAGGTRARRVVSASFGEPGHAGAPRSAPRGEDTRAPSAPSRSIRTRRAPTRPADGIVPTRNLPMKARYPHAPERLAEEMATGASPAHAKGTPRRPPASGAPLDHGRVPGSAVVRPDARERESASRSKLRRQR